MNADAFEVRHIHEQWQKFLKLIGEGDRDFIRASRNCGLTLYLYRSNWVFVCEALKRAVDRKLADRALIAEDFSNELKLQFRASECVLRLFRTTC